MDSIQDNAIIEIETAKPLHTHIEIISKYFGCHLRGHMTASWRPSTLDGWMVWFPKMLKNRDGSPKAKEGWINTISDDGEIIHEYMIDAEKNIEWAEGIFETDPIRIVFAYNEDDKCYHFKGVFISDREKSKPRDHYFNRIATSVEILGSPADGIKFPIIISREHRNVALKLL